MLPSCGQRTPEVTICSSEWDVVNVFVIEIFKSTFVDMIEEEEDLKNCRL